VVITTEKGSHYLSIAPHPHRLSFVDLQRAIQVAHVVALTQTRNAPVCAPQTPP
jgi:hypothetical protein